MLSMEGGVEQQGAEHGGGGGGWGGGRQGCAGVNCASHHSSLMGAVVTVESQL